MNIAFPAVLAVAIALPALTGCANLLTIDRKTSLPRDDMPDGVAIHLDAKQRLAYQSSFGTFCAEPSPDALSVAAASVGAGAAATGAGSASAAGSFAEGAGSIGLRTQTITLMRDALYRICEMYYGRGMNQTMVAQMHRRYQDVIVALLAVEQLTGPAIANQVVLSGNASSGSRASVGAVDNQLESAKARRDRLQGQLNAENDEVGEAQEELDKAQTALDKATNENRSELQKTVEMRQADLDKAKAERDKVDEQLRNTIAEVDALEDARRVALAAANSGAGVTAGGIDAQDRSLDNMSIEQVAETVEAIATAVIEDDLIPEQCSAFLMDRRSVLYDKGEENSGGKPKKGNRLRPDHFTEGIVTEVKDLCMEILRERARVLLYAKANQPVVYEYVDK